MDHKAWNEQYKDLTDFLRKKNIYIRQNSITMGQ